MIGADLGPYRIESELGSGGMGKVYLAEATEACAGLEPGTKIALKVVHPHLLQTPGYFKRFMQEADLCASHERWDEARASTPPRSGLFKPIFRRQRGSTGRSSSGGEGVGRPCHRCAGRGARGLAGGRGVTASTRKRANPGRWSRLHRG